MADTLQTVAPCATRCSLKPSSDNSELPFASWRVWEELQYAVAGQSEVEELRETRDKG